MSLRRALALAACGLAGGSVLLSAVVVGKQPARGGEGEPHQPGSAVPATSASASTSAAPPGLLLLPPATGWIEKPAGSGGYWDSNWDRREPLALINHKKKNEETGERELSSRLDHYKAKATRHIFLIRHSQYNVDGQADTDRTLTPLGREQAELTGQRLASLGVKFDQIIHSSMTRATETTEIISKHLPGVKKISTDMLREGAPIEPDPPVSHWKPEAVYYEDGARIEAAFRNFIHRADTKQEEDSHEIYVCHANVIRYIVCSSIQYWIQGTVDLPDNIKVVDEGESSSGSLPVYIQPAEALQFPPEGWLRLSLNNGSITHLVIRPNGRVALRTLGDTGFMPPHKITRT